MKATRRIAVLVLLGLMIGVAEVSAGPAGTEISKLEDTVAALQAAVAQLTAAVAALAARVTVLAEGGTPPPVGYPLTLTITGTGQGTVAAGGARLHRPSRTGPDRIPPLRRTRGPQRSEVMGTYPPGAPVTLTATPDAGSTFGGWSPAPCAPLFTMPAHALTCTATFLASVPPVTGTDWQRLPTGADAVDTFSFTAMTWDSQRHQAIATGWEYEPWCFTSSTNSWAKCGAKGPSSGFHNGGYAYDPHNDRYWVSTASGTEPNALMVYWQRATGVRVEHAVAGCGMDPALLYDAPRKRFICFGGWSTPVGQTRLFTFALDPPATAQTAHYPAFGPLFEESGDASKMTNSRAGVDVKRARIWYVDQNLDLWLLDPAALTWTKSTTTGTKPDKFGIFQRHEAADQIIAWVAQAGVMTGGGTVTRKTYALNPTTLQWAELATASVPPYQDNINNQMIYDPVGQRILLHTGYNFTRETWALTLGTTPPPPTSHVLTITTAGTGTGTTTGAGTYPANTVVALTATPASGSTFGGWSGDADCADASVTMTGTKTCTATFTLTTPPPTGACLPTAPKTFSPCEVPSALDTNPFATGSKDLMWTFDTTRQKVYLGLGDNGNSYANGSGNHVVWAYDASTNSWAVTATFCGVVGTVSPNHPTDYGVMVYDPGRDRVWWLGQGDGFPPGQEGSSCTQGAPGWPTGSIRRNGFLALNPATNTWMKASEQATTSLGGAYFDAPGDRVLTVEGEGRLTAWAMGAMPAATTVLADVSGLQPAPGWTGTTGGWLWPEYVNRVKWAWDAVGRVAYIPTVYRRVDVTGTIVESGVWMVTVPTTGGAPTLKARAPLPPGFRPDPYFTMSVWDSVNQKVILPVMNGSCGKIEAMLVYHPTTDTWEPTPVPPNTHGATIAYDPARNVVLLGGREFCEGYTPNPPKLWLWRFAP